MKEYCEQSHWDCVTKVAASLRVLLQLLRRSQGWFPAPGNVDAPLRAPVVMGPRSGCIHCLLWSREGSEVVKTSLCERSSLNKVRLIWNGLKAKGFPIPVRASHGVEGLTNSPSLPSL